MDYGRTPYDSTPYDVDIEGDYISEDDRVLKRISRCQRDWLEYYSPNFVTYRIDKTFTYLDQWKTEERAAYKSNKKAILSTNVCYDAIRKMMGKYRENVPQFEVRSLNGKANPKEVKLRADWFRWMCHQSRSSEVFETALEDAISGGFGAFRVDTEYQDQKSFDQMPCVRKVAYPERCYFDPRAELTTKADGDYCGIIIPITREEFHSRWPDRKIPLKSETVFEIFDTSYQQLYTNHDINLIEHYEKEYYEEEIVELSNGMTMTRSDYKKKVKIVRENYPIELQSMMIPTIRRSRKCRKYKIMRYLVTNSDILEKEEFMGNELPIVFVPGDVQKVNGREVTISFIRFSVDAQRALNLTQSEIIQTIRTARRELFLATEANVAGQINKWRDPVNQQGVLIYNPDPQTGAAPTRLEPMEIPSTLMAYMTQCQQQIQATMGIYSANLGDVDNTTSGKHEIAKQMAGNLSGGIFFDNMLRAIEQSGRCMMSMLHKVFDNERQLTTLPVEGKEKVVGINQNRIGDYGSDFSDNDFDVICRSGPSYAIQKDEAIKMLISLQASLPEQQRNLLVDLIAENMDLENSIQIVNRMRTLVPEDILAKEEGRPPPPPKPDPMMMMQQQAMQMQQQQLQLKAQEIQSKQQIAAMDAQTKQQQNQLEAAKLQVELGQVIANQQIEEQRAGAEINKAMMQKEADTMNALAKIAGAHAAINKAHHSTLQSLAKTHQVRNEKAA